LPHWLYCGIGEVWLNSQREGKLMSDKIKNLKVSGASEKTEKIVKEEVGRK